MLGRDENSHGARYSSTDANFAVSAPKITLPKGGGAISGIGEKFAANPVTGTSTMTVPVFTSPSRSGFGPQLSLSYDSGAGNGPFGFGWSLSLPSITRRTDKGLPKYFDVEEFDTFILSGAEDLVPVLVDGTNGWQRQPYSPANEPGYIVQRYRPRIEGLFARIERWTDKVTGISHWRSISKDNITTLYGDRDDARISDPADPTRVFIWRICETYDDKGNATLYQYKSENASAIDQYMPPDGTGVEPPAPQERNRLIAGQFPQRYLKTIKYGNRSPRQSGEDLTLRTDWMFELVFDYGEHDEAAPTTQEIRTWPVRQDPFSLFRSTFDIRTYRLCRRILMFHHFPDELNGTVDYLVRSTDLTYKETSVASFISSVTQAGYTQQANGTYLKGALPNLDFQYTEVLIDETVRDVDPESIRNLPNGVDGARYRWVDLDSEGLTGVLSEQAEAWYYKRNLGDGRFGTLERVAPMASLAALSSGRQELLDLAGEGHLDLVQYDGPMAGFYRRRSDGGWDNFTPFKSTPNINTKDPNLRFVDITGDGFPDILISEDTVFTWYASLAKDGFERAKHSPKSRDEEKGPRLVFSDPTQSIFVADMTGDGLSDIIRIRLGEVCYWPNIGYGRFGAKVTMGNAPVFDSDDLFDPRRIHLADIDGSGNADIIYVGHDRISLYFNQSGNFWSSARHLSHYPQVDNLTSIAAMDLLGTGTACLVWSSPLASNARQPMRYIDLMGGQKPHLLVHTTNNMGAETDFQYKASTHFYVRDREEGHPWVTKLPFPVQVIERVESRDLVSNTTLVNAYRYRHGYYDGVEREFRGFAYVEQRDAESVVGQFDLPPVVTRTWFHNGAYLEEGGLEAYFKRQEFFSGDAQASFLPDSVLPTNLSDDEMREAARALKGCILRQEVYADDASPKAALPYSVSERNYAVTCLQPRGPNRYAVFFTHSRETLEYHYERNPADPRISHALTLAVDDYGNVLKSAALGYQRRPPAFDGQKQTLATLAESQFTNAIMEDDAYRTPLPAEAKTYELTAPVVAGAAPLDFDTIDSAAAAATEIAYETQPTFGQTQKRLIAHLRTVYRKNDLTGFSGTAESMALPGESYKLALTPGLLALFQSKAAAADLTSTLTGVDGGYLDLDGDGNLWIPSGQIFYSPGSGDTPPQELAFATAHFFVPHRFRDPFGNDTVVTYDANYILLPVLAQDAVGNATSAEHDYRVLKPATVTDPNGNRAQARFDALGMLAGTAVLGKASGPVEGDSFDDFVIDLTPADVTAFFAAADPGALAVTYLGTATTRIVYDLGTVPICAASITRETHVSDLASGNQTKVQLHFVYSDGFGRKAQTKAQAEPGPLDPADPNSQVANPRWVGNGEKVYNNKGNAVRQYEPFFSATPQFSIEKWGVSSTLFYDPVERVVATLHPNNTFAKVVFDAWQQTSFDVNDTVIFDPKIDPDVGAFFSRLPDADYLPTWYQQRINGGPPWGPDEQTAAQKAAVHANTPTVTHLDTLGRPFLRIADNGKDQNGNDQQYATRTVLDIEGNQREIIDALSRTIMRYDYDMPGACIHHASMEAGERWMLNDATGRPIRGWNSRGYAFSTEYDALRRSLRSLVQGGDPNEPNATVFAQPIVYVRTIYGESADTGLTEAQQQQANLKAKVFTHFDGAGVVTTDLYDFKGNSLHGTRQFASDYKNAPDWSQNPAQDSETFTSTAAYDALSRVIAVTTPDNSVYRPTFNEAGLLETVGVNLRGAAASTPFVTNIDYDAKGQRMLIEYGNGSQTAYCYDRKTFRLKDLKTNRPAGQNGTATQIFTDPTIVQDLHYTYDPVGNITRIADAALITVFNAQQVNPICDYTYDPLYRLTDASGREHVAQSAFAFMPPDGNYRDYPFAGASALNDLQQLRNYTEHYGYDPVGNFLTMAHVAGNGAGNWTRTYAYNETSILEATQKSNRLSQTALQTSANPPVEPYKYDAHGNMVLMPHLPLMKWDFKDQLSATSRQVVNAGASETTYYVYDGGGLRARKITEGQDGSKKNERFYLGGFEIYREYGAGSDVTLARETLHVIDDKQRIALIETQTFTNGVAVQSPVPAQRYQLANHLGSACLELDETGGLISYEEYSPYGNTTYQAGQSAEVSLKRYRYTGMERDEENGCAYHGARYYAPWVGRWTSCDPVGLRTGLNLYVYSHDNSVRFIDPDGKDPPDVVTRSWTSGKVIHQTESLHRGTDYSQLTRTFDFSSGLFPTVTEHLYRGTDFLNPGHVEWTDVTKEASQEGPLSVEWRMPSQPQKSRASALALVGEMIVSEIPPSLVIPYVKDSVLADHYEFTPSGENPYQHWASMIGRRWSATGARKTSFWLNKVVTLANAGVAATSVVNTAAKASRALDAATRLATSAAATSLEKTIAKLGISEEALTHLKEGELVFGSFERGEAKATATFALEDNKLTAGMLSIKAPKGADPWNSIKAFLAFKGDSAELARQLGANTLRLEGNAVLNPEIEQLLLRQGYVEYSPHNFFFELQLH